jgi:hypothetical protein
MQIASTLAHERGDELTDQVWVQMPEPLLEQTGSLPGALGRYFPVRDPLTHGQASVSVPAVVVGRAEGFP